MCGKLIVIWILKYEWWKNESFYMKIIIVQEKTHFECIRDDMKFIALWEGKNKKKTRTHQRCIKRDKCVCVWWSDHMYI